MPSRGNQVSKHSYASSLDPGPPCSKSTLRSALVPTRLVQTRNSPLGVLMGISRDPPARTSRRSQLEVSKYEAGGPFMADKIAHSHTQSPRQGLIVEEMPEEGLGLAQELTPLGDQLQFSPARRADPPVTQFQDPGTGRRGHDRRVRGDHDLAASFGQVTQ